MELLSNWRTGQITTATFPLSNEEGISLSYLKYDNWRKGKLVDTELQKFAMRWYGIEEFKLILESVGFSDITCSAKSNHLYTL